MSLGTPEIIAIGVAGNWVHQYQNAASLLAHSPHVLEDCLRGDTELFDTAGFALKPVSRTSGVTLERAGGADLPAVTERLRAVIDNRGLAAQLLGPDDLPGEVSLDGLRPVLLGEDGPAPGAPGSLPANPGHTGNNRGSALHMVLCHPFG